MALLATQVPGAAGVIPAYTAASATDTFTPDGDTLVHVLNTNAATRTVTIGPATVHVQRGQNIAPMVSGTIAATTGTMILGPFPADQYADATTGLATITPSATAGVTYAVVRAVTPSP
jgi:hypothetical protein